MRAGTVHQVLVYDGDACVGWCQYGPPAEVASIKNSKAYAAELTELPDWRIGCIFTGSRHRGRGVARAAVAAVLTAIEEAGGGLVRLVEAYPEQVEGRPPQRGAYLHTGPEDLFEEFGFERDRRIAQVALGDAPPGPPRPDRPPPRPASPVPLPQLSRPMPEPSPSHHNGSGAKVKVVAPGGKVGVQSRSGKRWMISCRPGPTPIAETRAPISSSTRST